MNNGKTPRQLELDLAQFIGTTSYYRYWGGISLLTDGVKYLADEAECYWLLDIIGSYQAELVKHPDTRLQEMQFWHLKVHDDRSAHVTCVADSGELPVVTQQIPFTDFPLAEIQIWIGFEGNTRIAMLPSEY